MLMEAVGYSFTQLISTNKNSLALICLSSRIIPGIIRKISTLMGTK